VLQSLVEYGVERIDVTAYGTEVDFCEELGFRRVPGLVSLQLNPDRVPRPAAGPAARGAVGQGLVAGGAGRTMDERTAGCGR
jgi:hypothetical protein